MYTEWFLWGTFNDALIVDDDTTNKHVNTDKEKSEENARKGKCSGKACNVKKSINVPEID